jgi:cell division protein ZipA
LPDIDTGGHAEHRIHAEHPIHAEYPVHESERPAYEPQAAHQDEYEPVYEAGHGVSPGASPEAPPRQAPLNLSATAEHTDALAASEPSGPNAEEQQKIISMRVCAVGDGRWSGRDLSAALEGLGLAFGRYQVFHRKHADGRSIFFVASLIEPGTFDAARMDEEEFRGVSLFAVLPGPLDALQTVDALLTTARELARDLSGTVQDGKGMPFSPQRVAALREDVARFQSRSSPYGAGERLR